MNITKLFIPSLLAGLAMFVWGVVSHMLLPIGSAGIKEIPNENIVVDVMKANITQPGFYFFPSAGMTSSKADEQQKWVDKYKAGPVGIMIYQPTGKEPMAPMYLVTELITNFFAAFFAAIVLMAIGNNLKNFLHRSLIIALLGLIASVSIDFSYWNWYSFPTSFTIASLIDQTVGFFCVGLVLAWRIKPAV